MRRYLLGLNKCRHWRQIEVDLIDDVSFVVVTREHARSYEKLLRFIHEFARVCLKKRVKLERNYNLKY